ncbi:MAG: hypothetical protein LBL05_05050 [Synergistaceae bacterium]|jgi:hypothetical protein|nr:hypothetical protein [Synergistaceae bacterium]
MEENVGKREEDGISDEERANLERFVDALDGLKKEADAFDVSSIRDEKHLRTIMMERVLETAVRFYAVTPEGGKSVPLSRLPKEEQESHLDKIMPKILDSFDGPGPLLRRSIARIILDYRMSLRLKEKLTNLRPKSPKYDKAMKSAAHLESMISLGVTFLYAWPLLEDDSRKKEFMATRKRLLEQVLEDPEAYDLEEA